MYSQSSAYSFIFRPKTTRMSVTVTRFFSLPSTSSPLCAVTSRLHSITPMRDVFEVILIRHPTRLLRPCKLAALPSSGASPGFHDTNLRNERCSRTSPKPHFLAHPMASTEPNISFIFLCGFHTTHRRETYASSLLATPLIASIFPSMV